jgi:hypothetical protein
MAGLAAQITEILNRNFNHGFILKGGLKNSKAFYIMLLAC